MSILVTFTWAHLTPPSLRKPTIAEALETRLARVPTNAELIAEVKRIQTEVLVELAEQGRLPFQRKTRKRR